MDTVGLRQFAFRHVEKIVLAIVIIFVGYHAYSSLTGEKETLPGPVAPPSGAAPTATREIEPAFYKTAEPYALVPKVTAPRYNWFYPPEFMWLRRVELREVKNPTARRPLLGRLKPGTKPETAPLTEEERVELGLPAPVESLTQPCQVQVNVAPGAPGDPQGDILVLTAVKAGKWIKVTASLDNEDKRGLVAIVQEQDIESEFVLARATILSIKEEPLGTVAIRFTAPQGTRKSGKSITTYVEPAYYAILRKGERDNEEAEIGRVEGRLPKAPEPTPGAEAGPKRGQDVAGFPGAPPAPKSPAPPTPKAKGGPAKETGELVFLDESAESETNYTYRIRSIHIPKDDAEKLEPVTSEPKTYRTLEKFSFAYVGGDAYRADIKVFIGPRDQPLDERLFKRIPIGGWVGDVPKEFRPAPPAPPADAEAAQPPSKPPATKGPPPEPDEAAAARFVTRFTLVGIEQGVLHPVEYTVRVPDPKAPKDKPRFITIKTWRVTTDPRVILRDRRNQLVYLWIERPGETGPPTKGGK